MQQHATMIMTTVADAAAADAIATALQAIESLHPYEVPEILVVPVTAGLPGYLQWLAAETAQTGE